MASIIPGFEYDIFISYRQNDNKNDGWVSEFVKNLKGELESTFKDDISIYFDENAHDRLLETYNVEKSLNSKLKSFIFIPIISQTYCDPKCYAWQHEFLEFIRISEEDHFGKDIKLRNGNVAGRILPIRIHDIDTEDIKLFEKETNSVMRAMDFIFKTSTGVNRPLRANEDHPNDNLNKTYYRDQINKVANAISEIFRSLVQGQAAPPNREVLNNSADSIAQGKNIIRENRRDKTNNKKTKRLPVTILLLILLIGGLAGVYKITGEGIRTDARTKLEKSIAVLPFRNDSPNDTNAYFINGLMEEILNHLQMVKDLRVISRTSVEQYRNTTKAIPVIAKEQGVNYIVEGSGQKYGRSFNVTVQLIRAVKENQLWGKSYEQEIRDATDIINVQSKIAQSIVAEMKAKMTPEEKQLIEKVHTTNLNAYEFYQRGREELLNFWVEDDNNTALKHAGKLFERALEFDPAFADAYAGQAEVFLYKNYWRDMFSESYLDSVLILANRALSYDDQLAEAHFAKGAYYDAKGMKNNAIEEYERTIKLNPNDWKAYNGIAELYEQDDQIKFLDNMQKAALINHSGLISPKILRMIGGKLEVTGFKDKAMDYYKKAFELDGDSAYYLSCLGGVESDLGNYDKSIDYFKRAYMNRANFTYVMERLGEDYERIGKYKESLKYFKEYTALIQDFNQYVGYSYWQNGLRNEANQYFNEHSEFCQNILKTTRPLAQTFWACYDLASIYAFRGNRQNALKYLKLYSQNKNCELWMLTHMKRDPLLNSIRNEPEFSLILTEMETNYKIVHEKVGKWLEEHENS